MPSLLEADPSLITDKSSRACAKLARIARMDVVRGGAKALTIAKRAEKLRIIDFPAMEVVNDIYTRSSLDLGKWGAYYCPKCDQVVLGRENAYAHCNESAEV